jgi:hypothetical protein
MTKTLNQIFVFPPPESEYFFQQHWESQYFFRKKNQPPPFQVKWSFPNTFCDFLPVTPVLLSRFDLNRFLVF